MAGHGKQALIFIGDKLPLIFDTVLYIHALSPGGPKCQKKVRKYNYHTNDLISIIFNFFNINNLFIIKRYLTYLQHTATLPRLLHTLLNQCISFLGLMLSKHIQLPLFKHGIWHLEKVTPLVIMP